MSAPTGRKIGEPFNPWRRFNGVFVPLGLLAYPGLSDGAKLLYGRLGLYAGKDGACYAGRDTMAKDMGVHVATITRLLNELTQAGFIRRIRRGPGRNDACEFLYHAALVESEKLPIDVAEMRDQGTGDDVAEVQHQGDGMMSQECAPDVAEMRLDDVALLQHPYKEYKIHSKKIHKQDSSSSSSREGSENSERSREPVAGKRKKIPLSSDTRKPKTGEAAWYEIGDAMEQAAAIIRKSVDHGGFSLLPQLEVHTVMAILKHMAGLEDLQLWLDTARVFHASAKTWGRIVTDAGLWPRRRQMTGAIVERAVPVPVAETSSYEEPTPIRQPHQAEHKPPEPFCALCGKAGIREATHDKTLWEWCTCIFAEAARQKHPGYVDECNERVVKLRNRFSGAA